jgi:hypothetical protein
MCISGVYLRIIVNMPAAVQPAAPRAPASAAGSKTCTSCPARASCKASKRPSKPAPAMAMRRRAPPRAGVGLFEREVLSILRIRPGALPLHVTLAAPGKDGTGCRLSFRRCEPVQVHGFGWAISATGFMPSAPRSRGDSRPSPRRDAGHETISLAPGCTPSVLRCRPANLIRFMPA